MKRIAFIICLLVSMTLNISAQTILKSIMSDFQNKTLTDGVFLEYNMKLSDIQGSPYLDDQFSPGTVVSTDGSVYNDLPLRYNGYSDDLEFKKGNKTYNIQPKTRVKRAEFGGKIFSCLPFEDAGKTNNGYFEIKVEGKASFLIRYSVKFFEKEQVKPFADPKPARFEGKEKSYYVTIDGNVAKQILNKKGLIGLFGQKKDEMESYISKNKLSIREDESLSKIISYYNNL